MTLDEPMMKACEQCGTLFTKPRTCSVNEWMTRRRYCRPTCKQEAQKGKPSGKTGWKKPGGSTAQRIPCRICGGPTKYCGTIKHKLYGLVSCDELKCKEASRLRKNAAIKAAADKGYADGTRNRRSGSWIGIVRVSAEETLIKNRLELAGWKPQHMFITSLKGRNVPRTFWLDFAKPEKKLCVEIDGSIHRRGHIIVKDRRRDEILRDQGWQVLRLTSKQVREDTESILIMLSEWDKGHPPLESAEPQPKLCELCGNVVDKPGNRFCSAKCRSINHSKQLLGRPSKIKGIKKDGPSKMQFIPCRICGEPTKINGTPKHPRWGKKACDKPECQAASKLITGQNQSRSLKGNQKLIDGTKRGWTKRRGSKVEKSTPSIPSS